MHDDFGPFHWREITEHDCLPRGFEFALNIETGKNYAHLPRRLALTPRDSSWASKCTALASWGEPDSSKLMASLHGRPPPVSALHTAVEQGHERTCAVLMDAGALIDAFDEGQQTALHRACFHGCEGILKLMKDKHKERVTRWEEEEAQAARKNGRRSTRPESFEELLQDLKNGNGLTPLEVLREEDWGPLGRRLLNPN